MSMQQRNGAPHLPIPPTSWRDGTVAASSAMQEILATIEKVAPSTIAVLLLGETGTGKEVLARAIHAASGRTGPFVPINCAALPPTLAESELFGHARGAFTSACSEKKGLMEQAQGGTLFLDEAGELDLSVQGKLLRGLEDREVRPVGSVHTIAVDCRIIAATNRDLELLVHAQRFREDLYYRLSGITLTVPPLRTRTEDILPLLLRFLKEASKGQPLPELEAGTVSDLCRRQWRGNVRELRQATWRAVVLGGAVLTSRDFLSTYSCAEPTDAIRAWISGKRWKEIERSILALSLEQHQTIRAAASALGIPKSTLADRIRQLKLPVPDRTESRCQPPLTQIAPEKGGACDDPVDQLCRDPPEGLA